MGFKLSVILKVSTAMHDTEWESGIQNSEQLKPQSFAHNTTQQSSTLKRRQQKEHVKQTHRAMFKLGGKKLFVLCLLVKNMSAVYSADR